LARELNVSVLALSQLSRNVEKRDEKRPQLSDLRDSGSLEQDADVVIFVLREEYYLEQRLREKDDAEVPEQLDKVKNRLEFIIAKQRNDATGVYPVFFDAACNHLSDFAR
jgi:replicative DNA helicase